MSHSSSGASNAPHRSPPSPMSTTSLDAANGAPELELQASATAGEVRSYHFSPQALRCERALLAEYRAEDLPGLLEQAHFRLMGLSRLMKSVNPNARLRGEAISSLGFLLEQASALVGRLRTVYSTVQRVKP